MTCAAIIGYVSSTIFFHVTYVLQPSYQLVGSFIFQPTPTLIESDNQLQKFKNDLPLCASLEAYWVGK